VTRLAVAALIAVAAAAHAAGNVTTRIEASRLLLDGDDAPNAIAVTSGTDPDSVRVVGQDGTTVDGLPETTAAGIRRVIVRTGDGADRVELRQLSLRGDVHLKLGRGADALVAEQVDVRRLDVRSGRGRDAVSVGPQAHVRGVLHVRTGPDRDVVLVDGSTIERLVVATGHGDDGVEVLSSTVNRRTLLFTNPGDDVVSFVLARFRDHVDVNLGDDDDILYLDTVIFDDDSNLDGGDGDDLLAVPGPVAVDDDLRVDDFEFF
jgi:hypothetical protein